MSKYPIELIHDAIVMSKELEVYSSTELIISSIGLLSRLDELRNKSELFCQDLDEEIVKLSSAIDSAIKRISVKLQIIELGCQFLYAYPVTVCKAVLYLSKAISNAMVKFIDTSENDNTSFTREYLERVSRELYRYSVTGSTGWYGNGTRRPNQRFIALEDTINSLEYSVDTLEEIKDEYIRVGSKSKDETLDNYIKLLEDKINSKKYLSTISNVKEFSASMVINICNYLDKLDGLAANNITGAKDEVTEYQRMLRTLLRVIGSAKIGD